MKFENVTVLAKANIYFEGKVISHTLLLADGAKKTLGIIYPGQYHFSTGTAELMQITAGSCRVRLDGQTEWQIQPEGSDFRVPANSGFTVEAAEMIEYICSFE